MIVVKLDQKRDIIQLAQQVTEPNLGWRYERGDRFVVKWQKTGDEWHIPHLVKKARLVEPEFHGHEHINEGEIEEYYIDPTNGDEVEPGYTTEEKMHHVAGRGHTNCEAFLTKDELEWLIPPDNLRNLKKKTITVFVGGSAFRLYGVFITSTTGKERDGFTPCMLSVDHAEVVKGLID